MKLLIQRVLHAQVLVNHEIVGAIDSGVLVFIGITHGDHAFTAATLANKLINLRIFQDSLGKFNKSLLDVNKQALIVSQFTL